MREVAHEIDLLLAARQLRLELKLSELPLVAKVDPMRFQQVVRNVLANAIKFSPFHGRIDLAGQTTPAGEIRIGVADQGPGIPAGRSSASSRPSFAIQPSPRTAQAAPAWAWPSAARSSRRTAAASTPRTGPRAAPFFIHLPARGMTETAPVPL